MHSVNRFYASPEQVKKAYDTERVVIYELFLNVLAANARIGEGKRILDAGCGLGIFTRSIRERFDTSDISGFDFSDSAVAQACEQGEGMKFFRHDVYDSLPEKYDVVICMELLEHLINPEAAARNLLDCLPDDGILFLTVPDGRVDRHVRHINFWSPESWEVFAGRLGQGTHDVKVGIVQHPKIRARRYNWAILKRGAKEMRGQGKQAQQT
jgi:2-polyprenyl-3-methyl-5-hydroxy-6-metoxy-1,4-benzoquinol methylase